ncbi:ParB/RepB/Spo0J family partition protein [Sphingomonadaceae bacterium]|nr:ParB/RepB/Spo0J family partition protein [Sphingomonadaceae bacterium]
MPSKQKNYLAGLLDETDTGEQPASAKKVPDSDAPRGQRHRGTTLLGRESALARVASGEVRQVTQLLLDPAKVRPWAGNARSYEHLSYENCRDLIDAILAEGGQKVPAVVRRISDDSAYDYEVIAGTRRHWSISWLRANSYPDMRFLAQVGDFDDEAAFRLADIENRARKDVSDLERAQNYAAALADHYGGHQGRMAERLKLSQGWLSKMLKVAALPQAIIDAFASPADVQMKPAYPLAQAVLSAGDPAPFVKRAKELAKEQKKRRRDERPALPASDVIASLLKVTERAEKPAPVTIEGEHGRPAVTILRRSKQGISLQLHAGHGLDRSDLLGRIERALDELAETGYHLQR